VTFFMNHQEPRSGDIPVATDFSRWKRLWTLLSAVGTADVFRRSATRSAATRAHRLKPVAKGISPLRGFCIVLWLALMPAILAATEHRGHVKLGPVSVPGVTVTATQGNKKVTAVTDDQGVYMFPDLTDGVWTIDVEMSGFSKLRQDVTIAAGAPPVEWELKMLPMNEIATLASAAPPHPATAEVKQPDKPAGSSAKNAPPAKPQAGFQRTDLNASSGAAAAASDSAAFVGESASDLAQRAADGLLINGSVNNGAASPFAQMAAFGNNRRTRALYSGAFGLIMNNSIFDARAFSLTGQNTLKPGYNHIVGNFSLGGPLKIPRLVRNGPTFFFTYQRTQNSNATTQPGLMPTALERNGDLSGRALPIIDPATGAPFAGNVIPQNRISPQARALLAYYPLPNFDSSGRYNYQIPLLSATHQDSFQSRLSKTLGTKNQLFGDFAFQRTATDNPNLFGFLDLNQIFGITGSASWTHRSTQRFSTTLKYQFSRLRTRVESQFANRVNVSGNAGISGNSQDPLYWGPPALNFAGGVTGLGDGQPSFNRNQTNAFSYSSFWNHSPHSFTFGADLRKQQFNVLSQQDARGTFTFTGAATGSDFADFLLGIPATSSIAFGNADKYFRQSVYDAFISDDWRVRTGLTLTLGTRWEYETPLTELRNRIVNLNISRGFTAATPVIGHTLNPDKMGIQPRFGFAWRPFPASSLIVRGGYGVYKNTSVYQPIVSQMAQQAPLSKSLSVQNSPLTPLTLANGFSASSVGTVNTFAVDPDFRIGYAQTWNVIVQRDLPASMQMVATYTGSKGTHLMQEFLPNTFPAGAVNPCPACPSGFAYLASNGNASRESGQIQLRRRLHNGLTASVQYTLAKAIDDAGFSTTGTNQLIAQNWLDLRAERSLSNFDQRHQVTAQAQYTTGMGIAGGTLMSGWQGALFKEWTVSSQIIAGSGSPLTPIYLAAVRGTGITGSIRADYTGAPIYLSGGGLFLNPTAFVPPSSGHWGNAGRNSIIGPSQFGMGAALSRTFRVNDRVNADLRIDAQNVLNHVTYPNWNTTITSAQFGLPTAANPMRKIQTTLRVRF